MLREGTGKALPSPGEVHCEDGSVHAANTTIPTDLPLGWHTLHIGAAEHTLIIVPNALIEPPHTWGFMAQLYGIRSAGSWGMGDYADLRDLADLSGRELGAGMLLVNPLHAPTPGLPVASSPYAPSSRRFANPLYLRVQDIEGYRRLRGAGAQAEVDAMRPPAADLVDYDAVYAAKERALTPGPRGRPGREGAVRRLADRVRHVLRALRAVRQELARMAGGTAPP